MKKNSVAFLALGCLSVVFTATYAGAGEKAPGTPAAVPDSYSPPELQTKDWDHYLYGTTALLIKEKKYDEALTRLVWFWDHILEYQPSEYGVRLSFALSVWKQLADVYPPALEKLKQIRDAAEAKALQGDALSMSEANSINTTLEEQKRTVELVKKLDQTQPELLRKIWRRVEHTMIDNGETAMALKYSPAPEEKWSKLQKRMAVELDEQFAVKILAISQKGKSATPEEIKQSQENMVRYYKEMEIAPLVKLCNAAGKKQLAEEIETKFQAMAKAAVGEKK